MGIFYKDCPQCASTHAAQAVQCGCGYHFDPDGVESDDGRLELAVHEEQLYEAYLEARLSQAKDAVATTRRLHRQDPKDDNRMHALRDAEARLKAAESELAIQREKTALLRRVATGSQSGGRPENTERLASAADHARLLPESRPANATKARARKKHAREAANSRRAVAGRNRTTTLPPVPVLTETARPEASASATAAFRAAQERLARAAVAAERMRVEPALPLSTLPDSATMPVEVRARVAERAEIVVANRNMRTCQNCFARVPDDVSVCRCGLSLTNHPAEMPPLVLEAGEKKSLHESALAAWISRRR